VSLIFIAVTTLKIRALFGLSSRMRGRRGGGNKIVGGQKTVWRDALKGASKTNENPSRKTTTTIPRPDGERKQHGFKKGGGVLGGGGWGEGRKGKGGGMVRDEGVYRDPGGG